MRLASRCVDQDGSHRRSTSRAFGQKGDGVVDDVVAVLVDAGAREGGYEFCSLTADGGEHHQGRPGSAASIGARQRAGGSGTTKKPLTTKKIR
jgi:hypothetical protein